MTMIPAMVPIPASALDPSRLPDGTDPWAVGYAMTVVRNCPGWTMDEPERLYRKGILPKAAFGSPEWGMVEDGVRTGIAAAGTTRSGHPDMCDDLPFHRQRPLDAAPTDSQTAPDTGFSPMTGPLDIDPRQPVSGVAGMHDRGRRAT